jgi:hypothetical protein
VRRPGNERGQLLILLGAWLFFGGGASSALVVYDRSASDVEKAVKRVLPESARKDAIRTAIGHWEYTQKLRDKIISGNREELLDTLRRKDAQPNQVEPLLFKLDSSFTAMDQDFLDLRFRIREQVNSDEWARIVAQPRD